jgi:aspartyl-tRNA(Asn)/glutamyl-tRNA(Gln) amidotransferase subunit A
VNPTLSDIAAAIRSGRTDCKELVRETFARIGDASGEGARCFIRLFPEQATAAASAMDLIRASGAPIGPLGGIPIPVKDLFDVAGSVTTAGSRALRDEPPAMLDAPIVARLRAAGAIIVGTTNMTEFAMGGVGINPHFGTPLSPYDRATGRIPGGSSSGAAVAVAEGMVPAAIGTDTAGSIQMPAAFCGVTGFKPTQRRVPLEGSVPLAPSLDSIGPIANSVACCAAIDAVLAGESDNTLDEVAPDRLTFAIPQTLVLDDLEPEVAAAFEHAVSRLSAAGIRIVEIPFTELREIPAVSFSVIEGYAWHRDLLKDRGHLYDPIVASRFAKGESVSAADYIALRNLRASLIRRSASVTRSFDALIMPTVALTPPALARFVNNEEFWLQTNRRMIRNPGIVNFLDRCALSVPCHRVGSAPVGLSIVGEHLGDRRLLAVGLAVERNLAAETDLRLVLPENQ